MYPLYIDFTSADNRAHILVILRLNTGGAMTLFHTAFGSSFVALLGRLIEGRSLNAVREILLLDVMTRKVMRIEITCAVPHSLSTGVMAVTQMLWNGFRSVRT